ncbi:MAG: hypothetical protein FJ318_06590 [SAR202 cluster bacterium]|nr:hypothetical protein [SAR202 cluster bacterium]
MEDLFGLIVFLAIILLPALWRLAARLFGADQQQRRQPPTPPVDEPPSPLEQSGAGPTTTLETPSSAPHPAPVDARERLRRALAERQAARGEETLEMDRPVEAASLEVDHGVEAVSLELPVPPTETLELLRPELPVTPAQEGGPRRPPGTAPRPPMVSRRAASRRRQALATTLRNRSALRQAVLLQTVLGPPKALQADEDEGLFSR